MFITYAMKRFYSDFIKYRYYILYYIKAVQKITVSDTALGYIWWFLDPFLNIFIYIIIVRVVFQQREPSFPLFFFSAMLVWRYFSMVVQQSATSISDKLSLCRDNYTPKFIFPMAISVSAFVPFLFSLVFLFVLMFLFNAPVTHNLLYLPLLIVILFMFSWTCGIFTAHIHMFMNDFANILPHIFTLGLFATPIFYRIEQIPDKYAWLIKLNPVAVLTTSFRNIFLDGIAPPFKQLIYLCIITLFLWIIGISLLYKYDKIYNKIYR